MKSAILYRKREVRYNNHHVPTGDGYTDLPVHTEDGKVMGFVAVRALEYDGDVDEALGTAHVWRREDEVIINTIPLES